MIIEAKIKNYAKKKKIQFLIIGIILLLIGILFFYVDLKLNNGEFVSKDFYYVNTGENVIAGSCDTINILSIFYFCMIGLGCSLIVLSFMVKKMFVYKFVMDKDFIYINNNKIPFTDLYSVESKDPNIIIYKNKAAQSKKYLVNTIYNGFYFLYNVENFDEIYNYIYEKLKNNKK